MKLENIIHFPLKEPSCEDDLNHLDPLEDLLSEMPTEELENRPLFQSLSHPNFFKNKKTNISASKKYFYLNEILSMISFYNNEINASIIQKKRSELIDN